MSKIIDWFKGIYGKNVSISRGATHNYLDIMILHSNNQVMVSMADCVKKIVNSFIEDIHSCASTLAGKNLFQAQDHSMKNEHSVCTPPWLSCCL